jgi:FkbM family methyltransferase
MAIDNQRTITLRRRYLILSLLILGLMAVSLLAIETARPGVFRRKLRLAHYWLTGYVQVDGHMIYFDPQDPSDLTRIIVSTHEYDPEETAAVRSLLRRGDTFIDVGANIGWYTIMASDVVGKEGRVIAFEPSPPSFDILRRNVNINKLNNVKIEQKALSNKRGTVAFHIEGAYSRLQEIHLDRKDVEVEAVPLDEYLKDFRGEIGMMKIDTEGAEGLILAGMRGILRNNPPRAIMLEFTPRLYPKTGFDPEAMLRELHEFGYEIYSYERSARLPLSEAQIPAFVREADENHHLNIFLKHKGARHPREWDERNPVVVKQYFP